MNEKSSQLFAVTDVGGAHYLTKQHYFRPVYVDADAADLWLLPSESKARHFCERRQRRTGGHLSYRLVLRIESNRIRAVIRWQRLGDQVCSCLVRLAKHAKRYRTKATVRGLTMHGYSALQIRRILKLEIAFIVRGANWRLITSKVVAILSKIDTNAFRFHMEAIERDITAEQLTAAAIMGMVREHFEENDPT